MIAVVVGTLLALIALPWVPKRWAQNYRATVTSASDGLDKRSPLLVGDWFFIEANDERSWTWIWHRSETNSAAPNELEVEVQPAGAIARRALLVDWPAMVSHLCVVLLLFGGLLTFVVRRERRRKAAA